MGLFGDDGNRGRTAAFVGGGALLLVGGLCLFLFGGCNATYSEGHRDGYVYKLSHKGYFIKSWEGELATPGFKPAGKDDTQALSNVFYFSVDDPAVVEALQNLNATNLVRLDYRQVWWNTGLYFGTDYRIVKVEMLPEPDAK